MRVLIVFLMLALASPAFGFSGRDHKRLSWNAIQNLHPKYKKLLDKHAEFIKHETPAPDFLPGKNERSNHIWHPKGNWGNNIKKVLALFNELVVELRPVLLKGEPLKKETARKLAHLAHYVQDLCQPLHTAQDDKSEVRYHYAFEKKWEDTEIKKVLTFRGKVRPITKIEAWHKANGKWSNQFYKEISYDYHDDKKFNRKRTFEIYRQTFSRAHRSTVEIWTSLFYYASLKKR